MLYKAKGQGEGFPQQVLYSLFCPLLSFKNDSHLAFSSPLLFSPRSSHPWPLAALTASPTNSGTTRRAAVLPRAPPAIPPNLRKLMLIACRRNDHLDFSPALDSTGKSCPPSNNWYWSQGTFSCGPYLTRTYLALPDRELLLPPDHSSAAEQSSPTYQAGHSWKKEDSCCSPPSPPSLPAAIMMNSGENTHLLIIPDLQCCPCNLGMALKEAAAFRAGRPSPPSPLHRFRVSTNRMVLEYRSEMLRPSPTQPSSCAMPSGMEIGMLGTTSVSQSRLLRLPTTLNLLSTIVGSVQRSLA